MKAKWLLVIGFISILTGCNPVEVKIAEEVVEDVAEDVIQQEELKGHKRER